MYTLHASSGSCAFAPHIVLEEIGEPYALEMMSNGHPEARSEQFRQINPKGRIPVLVADGFILTEAPAILLHLGLTNPGSGLMGSDPESIVRAVEWTNWLSSAVHAVAVRMIWKAEFFLADPAAHPALVESGMAHLLSAFALVEAKMLDRAYALGSAYSVVDPYLLVFFRWGNRMRIDMAGKFPTWTAHARRLEQRPAVQRALAQEGISLWK
ncbi:MAG TPA: glutathione S-transferase family protein [Beijerinckiaceae bacterium]